MAKPGPKAEATNGPTGERADRNRKAIVAAANKCFLSDGYDVAVDAIAAEAGVSKVTVYNHFGSKEALFNAVMSEALDEALSETLVEAKARLSDTTDVRDALVSTARAWVAGVANPSVLALRNLVSGELRRFPELGQAWEERGPGRFIPMLKEVLEQLVERGELRISDPDVAVIQLFALTLYPHLVFSSYGSRVEPELSDALIERGVDMFLDHYGVG